LSFGSGWWRGLLDTRDLNFDPRYLLGRGAIRVAAKR